MAAIAAMNVLPPPISVTSSVAVTDPVEICHRLAGYDFPWELNRSLEIAVLKTFCVPRIAHLLRQTGEFEQRTQKRYDDTSLIMGNLLKWGYDSPQGRAAIAQMNRIHGRFHIRNDDYLYVLSTLIYEPMRWNQHFGWRRFTPVEKWALFGFWREVGQRIGVVDIPATDEAFLAFNVAYETENFEYHPDNQAIGDAVVRLMQGWLPAIAAPLVPLAIATVVDEPMRVALGWQPPGSMGRQLIVQGLRLRQTLLPQLPRRRRSHFGIDQANRTYPEGYHIDQLGPDSVTRSRSRCPFLKLRSVLKGEL